MTDHDTRKNHFHVYKAFIVMCFKCGQLALYWSQFSILPFSEVVRRAERDGWLSTPQGSYCPVCSKQLAG